jgi:hypothetical protein
MGNEHGRKAKRDEKYETDKGTTKRAMKLMTRQANGKNG